MSKRLEVIVKQLFELVDVVECSDNNRYFFPTEFQFSSCRVMTGKRIGDIFEEMRKIVDAKPRTTEKEMHLLNNPDDCGECLGTGFRGRYTHCGACGGTGTTDTTVKELICPRCQGTGDTQNHERESNDCHMCNRTGHVEICPVCKGQPHGAIGECSSCDGTGLVPFNDD